MRKLILIISITCFTITLHSQSFNSQKFNSNDPNLYIMGLSNDYDVVPEHEIDPTVFNNSNFRYINRTQRDDWLQLSYLYQFWADSLSVWVNNYQSIYNYDMNGNITGNLSQSWNVSEWRNYYQATYTYDTNNNVILELSQNWDSFNNEWYNNNQYTNTYDANNNMITSQWDDWEDGEWRNWYYFTYTYDSNNNMINRLQQGWDQGNNQWVDSYQYTYTYDTNNNVILELSQNWNSNNNEWVNSGQQTYTYDTNNNNTSRSYQSWDSNNNEWVNNNQITETYDANNNMTSHMYQSWDTDNNEWINLWYNTYTYDATNNLASGSGYNWDSDNIEWVISSQGTYNYDDHNNMAGSVWQSLDGTEWVNSSQSVITWGQITPIISDISNQEMNEDQLLVLILSAQSPVSDAVYAFSAYSDTSAVSLNVISDTLHIVPNLNWNGSSLITVIATLNNGTSDTSDFILTVTPVNDSPEEFSVIYPTVSDTFSTHTNNDTLIQFRWGTSNDIDSDITYKLTIELEFFGNTYSDIHENIADTTINVASNSLDVLLSALNIDESTLSWYVKSMDQEYTVFSDSGQFVLERVALHSDYEITIPDEFAIHQNYPNPFNPVTTLRYDLPEQTYVNIIIYDMLGRKIRTLINEQQDPGYKSLIWNATNDYGKPVSAGIYLYQIQAGEYMQTKKMVLLK